MDKKQLAIICFGVLVTGIYLYHQVKEKPKNK